MTKERPILFSGAMVRAILDGRKTQTRRIAKEFDHTPGKMDAIIARYPQQRGCRYGQSGDRLWVRETWAYNTDFPKEARRAIYRADPASEHDADRWRPSIHMPRWASRITLEVGSVRVERLKAISEEDSWAEGIQVEFCEAGKPCTCESNPVGEYADLWESINGPGSWDANPFVWVVTFKRIKP